MNKQQNLDETAQQAYHEIITRYITGDDMHFNLYLDDETATRLKSATEQSHESRNAIIRKAINQWLDQTQNKSWPNDILEFKGIDEITPFEESREELKQVKDDPFS